MISINESNTALRLWTDRTVSVTGENIVQYFCRQDSDICICDCNTCTHQQIYGLLLHTSCAFSSTTICTVQRHATYKKSSCRWSHFTTSTAVIICICPAGAGNATYHTWWPNVCRRWASCLEYPTTLHHRLFVIAHFQTISQDLSIRSIILST